MKRNAAVGLFAKPSNVKGLTLLEVLVSVSIVAIIMATIYAAYTSNVAAIQVAQRSGEIFQTARIVLDRMSKDLASAYLAETGPGEQVKLGMICENKETDGKPTDSVNFTALAHLSFGEGALRTDLSEIGYYLEEDPETGGFLLYRRDHGIVDDDVTEGGEASELARLVTGLDIALQDSLGEEFEEWDSFEGQQRGTLPSLITIKLLLRDEQGKEQAFVTAIHPELAGLKKE